jgi:hypothetical protein
VEIRLALLAAPILALLDQVVSLATVSWACSHQHAVAVHAVHALFLIAAVATTLPAARLWHRVRASTAPEADDALAGRRFLAGLAVAMGSLSVLIIASMWMPTWLIAVCSA